MKASKKIAVFAAILFAYGYGYTAHEIDHFDDLERVQEYAKQDVQRAYDNVWILLYENMQCKKKAPV